MKKKHFLIFSSLIILFAICGCSTQISDGGGGSETNNKITVYVSGLHIDGNCVSGAEVSLYNDTFNPVINKLPDSLHLISDSAGIFSFKNIRSGKYNLYTRYDSAGLLIKSALIRSLIVDIDRETICSTSYLIPAMLKCLVAIDSSVKTTTSGLSQYDGYLCIYGTPFYSQENILKTSTTVITGVPPGTYSLSCIVIKSDTAQTPVSIPLGNDGKFSLDNNPEIEVLQSDTDRVMNVSVTIFKK